jgi:hypothetical protein
MQSEIVFAVEARDRKDLDWGVRAESLQYKLKQACPSYWFCNHDKGCTLCISGTDGKPPAQGAACYFCPVGQAQPKTVEDKLTAIIFSPVPVSVKLKEMDPNSRGVELARARFTSSGPFEA